MGATLSPPAILAKSFYHLVLKYTTPSVFAFLSFLRVQEMTKGEKTLFAFHPGALGEGYLCQILSEVIRGFRFPLPRAWKHP